VVTDGRTLCPSTSEYLLSADRSPGEWNMAVRQQAAVAHLGQLSLMSQDLDALLREAMVTAADTLDLVDAALFEVLASGNLRGRAGMLNGQLARRRTVGKVDLPAKSGSLAGYASSLGVSVVTADIQADERFRARASEYGVPLRAAIATPIGWDGRPIAVLVVYDRDLRTWTEDEVHFVEAVANTMGLAIERSRIEAELRDSSTRLDMSLSAGGLGAWSWGIDGDKVHLNAFALAMYGLTEESFTGVGEDFFAIIHPEDRMPFRSEVAAAIEAQREEHHVFRIVRPDTGEMRWIESWGRLRETESGALHIVGVCADITDRRRSEHEQASLLARERDARLEAEAARERLSFLAEASAVLSDSLEPQVILAHIAQLCVPTLAELCFIDLVDDTGELLEQAADAATPALLDVGRLVRKRRITSGFPAANAGLARALGGEAVLHTEISDQMIEGASLDDAHLGLFRQLGARSIILFPLVARGRSLGVVSLVRTSATEPFSDDDLSLVGELASRAALAIDNGQLFHSRNRVARSLQAALLPPVLPDAPGLQLAARYDVAETDVAIGGDFYDVIPIAPGVWGVVVGDVCGRGPDAAALTGLVRHTVRSTVVREQRPSRVLGQTNEAVLNQIDDSRFCTAAYLQVLTEGGGSDVVRIVASSAGHPQPILVRADGRTEPIACAGTLLGVVDDPVLVDAELDLHPGDAVVLYTDGVTEARRGHELFGEARLLDALGGLAGQSAEVIATGLEAAVTAFRSGARDDMAILVVRASGPP